MGGCVHRHIAGVLEVQGRLDLLGQLRRYGQEDELDVLATRRLGGYVGAYCALQALGAAFALAQLEQIGDLLGQGNRLIDIFNAHDGAAIGFPILAERFVDALAPFATGHHGGGTVQAVGTCTARHFAGFVFSGQAELEQLRRALIGLAVVQGEGGDRQLRACAELLDQRFSSGPTTSCTPAAWALA